MRRLKIELSWIVHIKIAGLLSCWLVFFLTVIAPFDIAELSFSDRAILMPMYGVITFFGYLSVVPIQNWIFEKYERWIIAFEIGFLILFSTLSLLISYVYYRSGIMNGQSSLGSFAIEIYYSIFLILLPVLIFLRWFLFRDGQETTSDNILLTGDNRHDQLQIKIADLIAVSSADNYVEVSFMKEDKVQKKLLRNTLKSIEQLHPDLFRVHRSHLINPEHFVEWKDSTTIIAASLEIPVSKTYKDSVMALKNRP